MIVTGDDLVTADEPKLYVPAAKHKVCPPVDEDRLEANVDVVEWKSQAALTSHTGTRAKLRISIAVFINQFDLGNCPGGFPPPTASVNVTAHAAQLEFAVANADGAQVPLETILY
jgi:hypothetical protein